MKRIIYTVFFASVLCLGSACEKSDLGNDCTPATGATSPTSMTNSSGEGIEFTESERKDGRCESFSCVSTQVRSNYCSEPCNVQRNCSDGFICQNLHPVGPLAAEKFCLLAKTCRPGVPADCPRGDRKWVCKEVRSSDGNPVYFCDQEKPVTASQN